MNGAGRRRWQEGLRKLPEAARREGLERQAMRTREAHQFSRYTFKGLLWHNGSTERSEADDTRVRALYAEQQPLWVVDRLYARAVHDESLHHHWLAAPRSVDACEVCGTRAFELPWIGCRVCRTGWWSLGVVP